MNDYTYPVRRVYSLDEPVQPVRKRRTLPAATPALSVRQWRLICVTVGVTSALMGWSLAQLLAPEAPQIATPALNARAVSADATTMPFGTAAVTVAPPAAVEPPVAPLAPFVVVRAWMESGHISALLDLRGRRFVARGLSVRDDHLIHVQREQVVITPLAGAMIQILPLPPGTWQEQQQRAQQAVERRDSAAAFRDRMMRNLQDDGEN